MKSTRGAAGNFSDNAKLSQDEIRSICDAAKLAWDVAPASARQITFAWKRRCYRSRLTSMRMLIETMDGKPVAARYH